MKKARWKAGFRAKVDAEDAAAILRDIEQRDGTVHPIAVVEAARAKRSPIHDQFEWDDTRAAHEHRLEQARVMVRCLVYVEIIEEKEKSREPAFVHIKTNDDRSYMSTCIAMSNADLREQVVNEALRGLEAWRRKWQHLSELAHIFSAIDQAKKRGRPGKSKPGSVRKRTARQGRRG